MDYGISGICCCMRPIVSIAFQHTKLEYSCGKAYVDVFCQVDSTLIYDTDYLCVSKPPSLNTSNK